STQKLHDANIDELEDFLNSDQKDYEKIHIDMNMVLYKAAKSPKLLEIFSGLSDYIQMSANMEDETLVRKEQVMKEYLEIMNALRKMDVELAELLTKLHNENSKRSYIASIEKLKEKETK